MTELITTDKPEEAFDDIDLCVMIGGFPRKEGMERKDLLQINGKIFLAQGKILDLKAKEDCKICVVANPANTNAMLVSSCLSRLDKKNVSCLTRLDQNRAKGLLAEKIGCGVSDI